MRTIILKTDMPCDGEACPHCRLVESALRRALGLEGHPMPQHLDGQRNQEIFVSEALAVGIEHECDDRVIYRKGHLRLEVDGQRVDLPAEPTPALLETVFRRFLHHAS